MYLFITCLIKNSMGNGKIEEKHKHCLELLGVKTKVRKNQV